MSVWVVSCVAWCALCKRVNLTFLLSPMSPYFIPLGQPRLTLAPGRGVSGATEVQYCTSQHALLSLPVRHCQLGQTAPRRVRCAMILIITIYKLWLSAVPCCPLFVLTCLQSVFRPLVAISAQDVGAGIGAFSYPAITVFPGTLDEDDPFHNSS
jgi:hypothetical protein